MNSQQRNPLHNKEKTIYRKIKYAIILMYATARGTSCVDFFGQTYLIAGNYVKRIK